MVPGGEVKLNGGLKLLPMRSRTEFQLKHKRLEQKPTDIRSTLITLSSTQCLGLVHLIKGEEMKYQVNHSEGRSLEQISLDILSGALTITNRLFKNWST